MPCARTLAPVASWWLRAACVALGAALLVAAPASAQERGFRLHREQTTSAGSWTSLVERPWYSGERYGAVGLGVDYGFQPLVPRVATGADGLSPIISHALVGQLELAGSLFDRVQLSASLPVSLLEVGRADVLSQVGPLTALGLGDPRVGLRVRLFGQAERDAFSAHLGADVWLPLGRAATHQGDTGVRLLPRATLAGAIGVGRWTVELAYLHRPYATFGPPALGMTAAPEARAGVALGVLLANERLWLGPEARFSMQVAGANAFAVTGLSLELLGGLSYLIGDQLLLGVAGGAGLFGGAGTPDARALVRLAWAPRHRLEPERARPGREAPRGVDGGLLPDAGVVGPADAAVAPSAPGATSTDGGVASLPSGSGAPPPGGPEERFTPVPGDSDGDGIGDEADRCPLEPETRNGIRDADGCPEFQLWKGAPLAIVLAPRESAPNAPAPPAGAAPPASPAFGATDSDADGVPDDADRCPVTPEDVDGFEDEDGCPERDNDGDGVPDVADQCPFEAETPNQLADDDGCPDTTKDTDGDGVPDELDRCPLEPENVDGVRDDDGCPEDAPRGLPPLAALLADPPARAATGTPPKATAPAAPPLGSTDVDDDGFSDAIDRCPASKEDLDDFEDEDGCPEPDNDGDGILDGRDKCPMAAETPNAFEDADGCPDVPPDLDGDGLDFAADRCPLEPGSPLDGCPHAAPPALALPGFSLVPAPVEAAFATAAAPDAPAVASADFDRDRVPDDEDACPVAAEDVDEFEDEDGCPEPDNDHDGVPDGKDKCPYEAETINGNKDDDGCPDQGAGAVTVKEDAVVIDGVIRFKTASATLEAKSIPLVKQVAATLRAASTLSIEIQGHTDDVGSAAKNVALSKRRAETILKFLVKAGVSPRRLIAAGYGPTRPRATNKTAAGRELNRRVEFQILGEGP